MKNVSKKQEIMFSPEMKCLDNRQNSTLLYT